MPCTLSSYRHCSTAGGSALSCGNALSGRSSPCPMPHTLSSCCHCSAAAGRGSIACRARSVAIAIALRPKVQPWATATRLAADRAFVECRAHSAALAIGWQQQVEPLSCAAHAQRLSPLAVEGPASVTCDAHCWLLATWTWTWCAETLNAQHAMLRCSRGSRAGSKRSDRALVAHLLLVMWCAEALNA